MPDTVIRRAKDILSSLESGETVKSPKRNARKEVETGQLSLLDVGAGEVVDMIRATSLDTITPIEAMNMLYELKKKVES